MQNGADNSNTYHDHFLPCDSLLISYIKSNVKKFYVLSKKMTVDCFYSV